jgi:hypothetical protein
MNRKTALIAIIVLLVVGGIAFAFWPKQEKKIIVLAEPGKSINRDIEIKPGEQVIVKTEKGDMNIQPLLQTHLTKVVDDFFKLPEGPQRQKYLDDIIDQQEKAKKQVADMEKAAAHPSTNPSGATTQPTKVQIRVKGGAGVEQSLPPALRSQLAEFAAAIAKRRAERGLPPAQGIQIVRTEKIESSTK